MQQEYIQLIKDESKDIYNVTEEFYFKNSENKNESVP